MKILVKTVCVLFFATGLLWFASCSKDRTVKKDLTDYTSLDDFYNANQLPEQSFTVDSLGSDSITGMHGTKIWSVPKIIFMTKTTHQDIVYPFTIKLIEAYCIKDMIFAKLPNRSGSKILQAGGELKVTAWKNSDELVLKQNCGFGLLAVPDTIFTGMQVYYGFTTGTTNDWNSDVVQTDYLFTNDVVTSLTNESRGYNMRIAKMGWISPAKLPASSGLANVTFSAEGNNTDLIDIYIVFKNFDSYMKVSSMAANGLPAGEPVTVVAIGRDASTMYYFRQDYAISNNLQITLTMQSATQAQVLAILETL
ncbi:MAG: hypothetical protein HY958_12575 [Bacteroidia bacterium]|nr:hypothetical protein [Bacteroidia bacterium]